MKKVMVVITAVLLTVFLAACASTTATPGASGTAGANKPTPTAGDKNLSGTIKVNGSTSVGPIIEVLAEQFNGIYEDVEINIDQTGSGTGISAIIDKTTDIGMSSRELKSEEAAKGLTEHVLCIDGIAVIVNKANTVADLSAEQVKKIFTGEVTNWSEVGGKDAKINLYSRESTSGTRGAFEELVLGKGADGKQVVIDDSKALIQTSNGNLAAAVGQDEVGIGYMSLGLVKNYNTIKSVKFNGVEATLENVKSETYKLSRPFLLLTNGATNEAVTEFLNYVLKDEGAKQYMEEKGYVIKD